MAQPLVAKCTPRIKIVAPLTQSILTLNTPLKVARILLCVINPFIGLILARLLKPTAVGAGFLLETLAEHIRYLVLTPFANITLNLELESPPRVIANPIGLRNRVYKGNATIKSKNKVSTPPTTKNQSTGRKDSERRA